MAADVAPGDAGIRQNAGTGPMTRVPPHWLTLMDILHNHPEWSVSLWYNANAHGGPGFTAQVQDGKGGFAPPIEEGAIWSAFASNPVQALNDLAYLVHKAVLVKAPVA